jgi:hypothetical protein
MLQYSARNQTKPTEPATALLGQLHAAVLDKPNQTNPYQTKPNTSNLLERATDLLLGQLHAVVLGAEFKLLGERHLFQAGSRKNEKTTN